MESISDLNLQKDLAILRNLSSFFFPLKNFFNLYFNSFIDLCVTDIQRTAHIQCVQFSECGHMQTPVMPSPQSR